MTKQAMNGPFAVLKQVQSRRKICFFVAQKSVSTRAHPWLKFMVLEKK